MSMTVYRKQRTGFVALVAMAASCGGDSSLTQNVNASKINVPSGHILCNNKWLKSELVTALKGRGASLLFDDGLGIIDFCPSNNVAIIYISEADLVAGLAYRRRIVRLRKSNTMRLIVAGEKTSVSAQYFAALQKFVVMELGLVLVPVWQQSEVAGFLMQLAQVEISPHKNEFRIRHKLPPVDTAVLMTLQMVPKLGEVKATALLHQFGSLTKICQASNEELAKVIGPSNASHVEAFFSQRPS